MRERPNIDGVPTTLGGLRRFVIERDGLCLAFLFDPTHRCYDKWDTPHRPTDERRLTLEHVPRVHSHLEGRRDNERHCVTLCHRANTGGPPRKLRDKMRDYLRNLYPSCSPEE